MSGVLVNKKQASQWLEWTLRRQDTEPYLPKNVEVIVWNFRRYWNLKINLATLTKNCGYEVLPEFYEKFINFRRKP